MYYDVFAFLLLHIHVNIGLHGSTLVAVLAYPGNYLNIGLHGTTLVAVLENPGNYLNISAQKLLWSLQSYPWHHS